MIQRLRAPLGDVAGARTFLQAVQDIRVGGRQSNAQYQFTLLADSTADLYKWGPKLTEALQARPELADVNSDQQQGGLEAMVTIDRATAARLNIKPAQIDNTLYDAFGQRQVSTIYNALNQYHVVMEVAPKYWQDPEMLKQIYVSTSGGSASGAASTNATAARRHVVRRDAPASCGCRDATPRRSSSLDSVRNSATNAIAASGKSRASSGAAVSTVEGNHDPAVGHREVRAGQHALVGQSPEPVRRLDDLVQSAARQVAVGRDRRDLRDDGDRSACPARSTAVSRARRRRSSNR